MYLVVHVCVCVSLRTKDCMSNAARMYVYVSALNSSESRMCVQTEAEERGKSKRCHRVADISDELWNLLIKTK